MYHLFILDLVDTAVGAGNFKTLVKLVQDLGLEQTLRNARGVTVFAPTDDAFAKLPAGTLESLSTEQAKKIVLTLVCYKLASISFLAFI